MTKKTIWITGGSTGIGKALAIKFVFRISAKLHQSKYGIIK